MPIRLGEIANACHAAEQVIELADGVREDYGYIEKLSIKNLLSLKLAYEPVCPSVGWSVGRSLGWVFG